MQRIPEALAFVDVETTGGSPDRSRVIEIGIWRTENGVLVDKLQTVIDPDCYVPREIKAMTGITQEEVDRAPSFRLVADQVVDLLDGAIFVAHNARFDYAFIRAELRRLGIVFNRPTLCTVKLLRKLRPDLSRYNLDVLIAEYEIECINRHRASDDAKVLMDFFAIGAIKHGNGFWDAAESLLKRPSWPDKLAHMSPTEIPEAPGVYIFKDSESVPIYIGKSVNLRDRVLSHFLNDGKTHELKISMNVADIEIIQTSGEMGALILESQLVKQHMPIYNRMLRKGSHLVGVFETTNSDFLGVDLRTITNINIDEVDSLIAVFKSKKAAEEKVREICELKRLCPRIVGLEKGNGKCFWRQIGKCDGTCDGSEPAWKHNAKFVEAVHKIKVQQWPFNGPTTITETTMGNTTEWTIDKWCVIKHVTTDPNGLVNEYSFHPEFDWDTYKILKKFLLK